MFINFWYPMGRSDALGEKPIKVRALDHQFVLFRDSAGAAHCLSNTCTHRGGSLAQGKVKGDAIECPYHGWQFEGGGVCIRLPSIGAAAAIPRRTQIDSYPVVERYGLVFAFLGDLPEAERPPIMPIPEWGQDGWRATSQDYPIACNYERSVENGLDPAHNEFVHDTHGFQGANSEYRVNELRIEAHDWGRFFWHRFDAPPLRDPEMAKLRSVAGQLDAGSGFHGPHCMTTHIHITEKNWLHQYMFERPVDERNIHVYLVTLRNCMLDPALDAKIMERNRYVAAQDIHVLSDIDPPLTPPSITKEFMVPADKVILLYREMLDAWEAMGWRIDTEALAAARQRGNVAYVIPSPARRESRKWVLDPVPLMPASAKQSISTPWETAPRSA